jgi:hypothetical protein
MGQLHDDPELAHGQVGGEQGGLVLGEQSAQLMLCCGDPADQVLAFVAHAHLSLPEKVIRKVCTR